MLQPHIQLDDTLNIKYAILPGCAILTQIHY